MEKVIDYYLSVQSPWAYLGHDRLVQIAEARAATIRIWPLDYAEVFRATGGVPLRERAPERQSYRLVELLRWSKFLDVPINLEPRYFPVSDRVAATMVIAHRRQSADDAVALAGAILRAVWAEQRDISDPATLSDLASEAGVGWSGWREEEDASDAQTLERDTKAAIAAGVFGAPTYVYRGELFWGQDRLNFLERALAR